MAFGYKMTAIAVAAAALVGGAGAVGLASTQAIASAAWNGTRAPSNWEWNGSNAPGGKEWNVTHVLAGCAWDGARTSSVTALEY
jgi:hypothetical protein